MEETKSTEARATRGWKSLTLLILVAVAAGCRLFHLTTQNLWNDEVYSWDVARKPIDAIVDCAKADVHPPFYYIFLKGWTRFFGESAAALRMFSVLASLAALWLAFRFFRKFADFKVSAMAVFLMGISAHQVFFAQEARMYAPVMALLLGAALGYHEWIESRGESFSGLSQFFWCSLTALYFHYFAMFAIAAFSCHFLVVLAIDWKKSLTPPLDDEAPPEGPTRFERIRDWTLAHVALILLFSPWIPVFLAQAGRGQTWRKKLSAADVAWNVMGFVQEGTLGYKIYMDNVREWLTGLILKNGLFDRYYFSHEIALHSGIVVFMTAMVLWGLIAWLKSGEKPLPERLLPVVLFSVPLVFGSVASIRQSLQLSRYLLYITPFLFFFIAHGCNGFRLVWLKGLGGVLCGLSLLHGLNTHYGAVSRDSDLRPALTFIKEKLGPGDRIVIDPDSVDICLFYYAGVYGLTDRVYGAQVVPTGEPNGQGQLERMRSNPQVPRWWVVLDYRSKYFERKSVGDDFTVVSVSDFPDRYPNVRVLEIRRK